MLLLLLCCCEAHSPLQTMHQQMILVQFQLSQKCCQVLALCLPTPSINCKQVHYTKAVTRYCKTSGLEPWYSSCQAHMHRLTSHRLLMIYVVNCSPRRALRTGCAGRSPHIWLTASIDAAFVQRNLVLLHCFDELIWSYGSKVKLASPAMWARRPFKALASVHRHCTGSVTAAGQ